MFNKIGVIGLGLIGGSLARAVKKHNRNIKILAVDICRDSLAAALADGNIDEGYTETNEAFCGSDIVIVCTGAKRAVDDINAVYKVAGGKTLITDVCSVKDFLPRLDSGMRYIGGHPMAGTEKNGYKNSSADLFSGKKYIITEGTEAAKSGGGKEKLLQLIKIIGATPIEMKNKEHDKVLAYISHLPHIAAYLLSDVCLKDDLSRVLSGGGFKDTTRIASSDPALWTEIVFANKQNAIKAIDDFAEALMVLREKIAAGDRQGTQEIFEKGKNGRDGIC